MDSFKVGEVKRMELGGNKAWKEFWINQNGGGSEGEERWEQVGVEGRYTGDLGDEWKERLSGKVENREFVPLPKKEPKKVVSRTSTPLSASGNLPAHSPTPATGVGPRKQQNEAYFAKLGNDNASRSADLPPSQGGKYAGFGSAPSPSTTAPEKEGGIPGVDEFQQDPVAALTKGFGWFSAAVGKSAKSVNEGWIQPTAQKVFYTPFTPTLFFPLYPLKRIISRLTTSPLLSSPTDILLRTNIPSTHHGRTSRPERTKSNPNHNPANYRAVQ